MNFNTLFSDIISKNITSLIKSQTQNIGYTNSPTPGQTQHMQKKTKQKVWMHNQHSNPTTDFLSCEIKLV